MLIENDDDIIITFNSSTATLRCREGLSPTDVVIARCSDNGTWIPNPTDFYCTSSTSSGAMIIIIQFAVLLGRITDLHILISSIHNGQCHQANI